MLLNRRTMLSASIGAIALSLSGCKSTKTTIVFVNNGPAGDLTPNSTVAVRVNATANGKKFNRTIAPGHSASQVYLSDGNLGSMVPISGTITPVGKGMMSIAIPPGTMVTIGYKNTFYIDSLGVVAPAPVVS